ncbi:MAG: T9SS type A sorting domain-containing protein, partial [Bacteroidia bacterium]|nr:T9SS type A sorting domain-containing protein [Bacteroidia bacterium]
MKAFSQTFPAFAWAKHIAGSNNEYITASTMDNSGNIYITGGFEGSVDFDPGPALFALVAVGQRDVFVAKYTSTGAFVWAKQISGPQIEEAEAITVDNAGNVYVSGNFENTVDFDPGSGVYDITAKGQTDIFVLKLDAAGNFIWVNHCGGNNIEGSRSVVLDNANNLYVAGYFSGTVDFDPSAAVFNLTAGGGSDAYIAKFAASTGAFQWVKQFAGSSPLDYCDITKMVSDASGNFYIAGSFQGTIDFDTGAGTSTLTSTGMSGDFFITKLDNSTGLIWLKYLDVSGFSLITNLSLDNVGNLLLTGDFESTVDFDPGPGTFNLTPNGLSDVFVLKLTDTGNFVWALSVGGSTGYDTGYSLLTTATNDIIVTGTYQGTVDFDPGAPIYQISSDADSWDIFILKLSSTGGFEWAKSVGGPDSDFPIMIHRDGFENLYITGNFSGTCDFDPDIPTFYLSANQIDAFILKLNASLTSYHASYVYPSFEIYPTVTNQTVYIRTQHTQNYTVQVFDNMGKKLFESQNASAVPVHSFATGLYYLRVQDNNSSFFQEYRF